MKFSIRVAREAEEFVPHQLAVLGQSVSYCWRAWAELGCPERWKKRVLRVTVGCGRQPSTQIPQVCQTLSAPDK